LSIGTVKAVITVHHTNGKFIGIFTTTTTTTTIISFVYYISEPDFN